jgi:hypothetical protein
MGLQRVTNIRNYRVYNSIMIPSRTKISRLQANYFCSVCSRSSGSIGGNPPQGAPCCVLQVRFKQHHNCFGECQSRMAMVRHDDDDSKPGECKRTAKKQVACQDSSVVLAASQTTSEIFPSGRCQTQSKKCLKGRRLNACPLNLHGELFLVQGRMLLCPYWYSTFRVKLSGLPLPRAEET